MRRQQSSDRLTVQLLNKGGYMRYLTWLAALLCFALGDSWSVSLGFIFLGFALLTSRVGPRRT